MAWSNGHGGPAPLGQPSVGLMEGLVYIYEGVDAGLAVRGRSREVWVGQGYHVWSNVLWHRERAVSAINTVKQALLECECRV